MTTHSERLTALRAALKAAGVDAFLQPMHDEFQNEYTPESAKRLPWLTGFDGSAGTVIVTATRAALFVDGRYTLQAAQEVDATLFEIHNSGDVSPQDWLRKALPSGSVLGIDPWLHSPRQVERLHTALAQHITLTPLAPNPIDGLWHDHPARPATPMTPHSMEFAGQSHSEKLSMVRQTARMAGADATLITMPDSLCWLLNVRGRDIPYTPFTLAYALVERERVTVFTDVAKVAAEVHTQLGTTVDFQPFPALLPALHRLGQQHHALMADLDTAPAVCITTAEAAGARIITHVDPCQLPKACKNTVEQAGTRAAHIRDGVALCRFFHWLEGEMDARRSGATTSDRMGAQPVRHREAEPLSTHALTEVTSAEKLDNFRAENNLFALPSFATISGYGPNGAIVHYRAKPETALPLTPEGLYLLDSGGQYFDGTTDVTRTIALGPVPEDAKRAFTLVLKGHIALAGATFPEGTTGSQLDTLARQFLWQEGLDYDHGTGHGVGSFLSVHEGPQRIGKAGNTAALQPGMILSNEPGYYKTGAYGIRIENLVLVVERGVMENGRKRLGLDTLTRAPIDVKLVERSLLTPQEIAWLNSYHQQVWEDVSPHVPEAVKAWLKVATHIL